MQIRLFFCCFFAVLLSEGLAQGPQVAYYYHPSTVLPWASCWMGQGHEGGSQQKIPFLPAISYNHSPAGTFNYSKDVHIDGKVVFVGNGIVKEHDWNSYTGNRLDFSSGPMDMKGKVALICYDFPDSVEDKWGKSFPVEKRIALAAAQHVAAVILFSHQKTYPFLYLQDRHSTGYGIPVISITENTALNLLESAGINGIQLLEDWKKRNHPPESQECITTLKLQLEGSFATINTSHFEFRFRKEEFTSTKMTALASVNERAFGFLLAHFKNLTYSGSKSFVVYFNAYDSKVFYTHHWGKGFSTGNTIFNVQEGDVPGFELAVHENMHNRWPYDAGSFLNEGIAMYAEALASDSLKNDLKTLKYLRSDKLYPLQEMMGFQIGIPGPQTDIGYPAAGSFIHFLMNKFGLPALEKLFTLESGTEEEKTKTNSWTAVYHFSLSELEIQWHEWLRML